MSDPRVRVIQKWGHFYVRPWRWTAMVDEIRGDTVYTTSYSGSTFTFSSAVSRGHAALERLINE